MAVKKFISGRANKAAALIVCIAVFALAITAAFRSMTKTDKGETS